MDPLQHLVAPRRPLPSTTKDGEVKKVFTLPVIHQFEPILASSPKSYMVANVLKKDVGKEKNTAIGGIKVNATTVESTIMTPSQPQRPKNRERVKSPRFSWCQPPAGISSRTDVDIYRYNQGTEQRMAIKPLFDQRSLEDKRPKRKVKRKKEIISTEKEGFKGGDKPVEYESKEVNENTGIIGPGEVQEATNQEESRTNSPMTDDYFNASIGEELIKLEESTDTAEIQSPLLLKKLDVSSTYEPFLKTEGPKLTWMREVIGANFTLSPHSGMKRAISSGKIVYKTLAKDLRVLGDKSFRVTVFLSSNGVTHITCKADGSISESRVNITNSEQEESKRLRPDLQVLTPKWAEWIITRVRCDSRLTFYLDLTDAIGDDLGRLALSLNKWSVEGAEDQEASSLFDDQEFLRQIVTKTNMFSLNMSCSGFAKNVDDSLLSGEYPVITIDPSSDALTRENTLTNLVFELLDENKSVGTLAFLVQAYVENSILSTLRYFQQQEAIQLNVAAYIQQAANTESDATLNARVERNLEAARTLKLRELAIISIVDDMILELIAFECSVEIHAAKYSGEFDDHYASKVQATFRMSTQKKSYDHKRHVRMRAAQMVQSLQRGIITRRRYSEMKVEREKYKFRSSLYHETMNMKDPRLKAHERSKEAERRRHSLLMQVIQGYVAGNFTGDEFRASAEIVQEVYNEYGVVGGCSTNFGDIVVSYLSLYAPEGDFTHDFDPPRVYSCSQVSAALLLGLRDQYDDTFGLSSNARVNTETMQGGSMGVENSPPRWMLKASLSFQQSNLNRIAALRLTRKAIGKKSAHLVARDYRSVLANTFHSFHSCRASWEVEIRARRDQQQFLNMLSVDELAQYCLDLLISGVKDWGIDPDPLFQALNLCGRHCYGKEAIQIVEEKFNAYAAKMNEVHNKQSVLTLREEISQELEDFEKLLALRCLNMTVDDTVIVPTSELLYIMLHGNLDEEYIRHGLSTVLLIASITEKHDLACKILYVYANASYGEAFNLICWSCLDVAENVTMEAARFLNKITCPIIGTETADDIATQTASSQRVKKPNSGCSESLAARALYLLTDSQAVRFMQFLAKVSHFNKVIQQRVLVLLSPYAEEFEIYRLTSAVCALEDFAIVSQLFDAGFSSEIVQCCTPLWTQYQSLFGEEKVIAAKII